MTKKSAIIFTLLCLILLVYSACSPKSTQTATTESSQATTIPSSAPPEAKSPTSVPSPTFTPTQAFVTVDTTLKFALAHYVSDSALGSNSGCENYFNELSPDEVILGGDPETCAPRDDSSQIQVDIPVSLTQPEMVMIVTLHCNGDQACMQNQAEFETEAQFQVGIDGLMLWKNNCGLGVMCTSREKSGDVQVSYRVSDARDYSLELTTTAGALWRIDSVEVELQELPQNTIRGFGYSPYRDCQTPYGGPHPTLEEIREDLTRLIHTSNALRTYSSQEINKDIVLNAKELGFTVGLGIWIDDDAETNELEIDAAKSILEESNVDFLIVGNEVMLRGEQTPESLAAYIERVKTETGLPVAYADIGSCFTEKPGDGTLRPKTDWQPIIDAVDYLLVHIYPYWDGISIEQGAAYVAHEYEQLVQTFPDKRIIIGETGWPSRGLQIGEAVPSLKNQRRFFLEFTTLAQERGIEYFYFAPFEEPWKTAEGEVGPSWGIITAERVNKFETDSLFILRENMPSTTTFEDSPLLDSAPTPMLTLTSEAGAEENVIYTDFPLNGLFFPSWWQGDVDDSNYDVCWKDSPYAGRTALRVDYTAESAARSDGVGWTGVIWEYPEENQGNLADGKDLSAYNHLHFYARGENGGEKVAFILGGTQTGRYPSSIVEPLIMEVTLEAEWNKYVFDLSALDLSHIIDGFGWIVSACKNPEGATFYLDDIEFGAEVISVDAPSRLAVLEDGCLRTGFDLGIDTSSDQRDWASESDDAIRLDYPRYQTWGAAFIFGNQEVNFGKPSIDLSAYSQLAVEMRGDVGGEEVWIGIKDANDPNDGTEVKEKITLGPEWNTYLFELANFRRGSYADLSKMLVLVEFVFQQTDQAETVFVRSVEYQK
ncbi:MAG: glycosyl hydrolase family 17 protein [Chloroflexota bacterium]|nr:glycosyl hydrolase family 17 protein [Chloroflexota bacterium]